MKDIWTFFLKLSLAIGDQLLFIKRTENIKIS